MSDNLVQGLRVIRGPWDHTHRTGKLAAFIPDRSVHMERLEIDYGEVDSALNMDTMHAHNRGMAGECSWNTYQASWHGALPKVPGVPDKDVKGRVKALLHSGCPKDAEKLAGLAEQCRRVLPPLGYGRRKRRFAKDGDELCVERWMDGADDPWIDYNRSGQKPSPYITLIGQFGGNGNITPEQMFWAGASAVAMTDVLESAGFRVRLLAAAYDWHGDVEVMDENGKWKDARNAVLLSVINLKGYDEHLRLGPVSFGMCHAGFFRTVGFGMILQSSLRVQSGLGSQRTMEDRDIPAVTTDNAVLVPHASDLKQAVEGVGKAFADLKAKFGLVEV